MVDDAGRGGDGRPERDERHGDERGGAEDSQRSGGWREVDEEVGLREEPWWEVADDREQIEAPVRPEDRSWHERDEEQRGRAAGGPSVERGADAGWWASLDSAQRILLFGLLALAALLALLAATYVLVLPAVGAV